MKRTTSIIKLMSVILALLMVVGVLASCSEGAMGPQGPAGVQGVAGADGKDGVDGKDGKDGVDGKDGKDGVDGKDGKDGVDGKDGKDGKSAYEIAVDNGFVGTQKEWLDSLVGKDGSNGSRGSTGAQGVGIKDAHVDSNMHLILELTNGTKIDAGYVGVGSTPVTPPTPSNTVTVTFDTNGGSSIDNQNLTKGDLATVPNSPDKSGFTFIGWYVDAQYSTLFDFTVPINSSCTVYARWLDTTDTTDTDGDGLTDPVEAFYGTNPSLVDTDGDGLSDYIELTVVSYNPLSKDTDSNSVLDGKEDYDSDGIDNETELQLGTDLSIGDTDYDGLTDKEEIDTYNTNPTVKDTDGDGVSDGKEIELGTDPLVAQQTFNMNVSANNVNDSVAASVEIELSGEQVETLRIDPVSNDNFFPDTMPGYMGKAYDFNVDGTFTSATISFEFDASTLDPDAEPAIYYFNEETQSLEELATTIDGNVASATVTHFSKYILINRKIYNQSFTWIDVWDSETTYTDVEIVLIIDDSGSMDWNDFYNQRLTVAQTLIDKLPQNSKVGIVKFEDYTTKLTEQLTDSKDIAKSYLTTSYFRSSGGTYMYEAINNSFDMFETTAETTLKLIVVLSDGDSMDLSLHNTTVQAANEKAVKIFCVGLGDSTTYFNNYLKPLSTNTGGAFYLAANADQLADIYKDISEKIDIETDSDDDGIPDYYEDNMICFNGVKLALDKNNSDTDGDGVLDGEEVEIKFEYNEDKTKVKVTGKLVLGNPVIVDTDGDGYVDGKDENPLMWNVSDRDLSMLSQLIYCDELAENPYINFLDSSTINAIDKNFYGTASVKELKGWRMVFRQEIVHEGKEGGLCYGVFAKDNNIVIAVRGSVGELDLCHLIDNPDWFNNFLTYTWTTDIDTEVLLANIRDVVVTYQKLGYNLYITGHSRGGMLAQRAAAGLVEKGFGDKINRVVYFNGMGIVFVKGLWGTGRNWFDNLDSISHKVTRFYIAGDIVGILGAHVVEDDDRIIYNCTHVAKENYEKFAEHALCNFTYHLMPERFTMLPED